MQANVNLRILSPVALLQGTGVDDSLANIDTTELPDGAQCYVIETGSIYVLDKTRSGLAPVASIAIPGNGPGWWLPTSAEAAVPVTTGDFTLSAEWGTAPSFSLVAGSNTRRGTFSVTAGTGPSAGPKVTLTFPTPTRFKAPPWVNWTRVDQSTPPVGAAINVVPFSSSVNDAVMQLTSGATVTTGNVYTFNYEILP